MLFPSLDTDEQLSNFRSILSNTEGGYLLHTIKPKPYCLTKRCLLYRPFPKMLIPLSSKLTPPGTLIR
ncbi:unknown protein [Desulfotalea psychrophila LSv54]|uniref:Uncharacterized protein n=1 Tax=Desulfotalea psychrophila (strain LSv54 / DSM 12343) TaxID=177439 RepID=Q6APQ3_DESPS|nr:unknown protein [Desulfotalea psychrophila LSv54]